MAVENEASIGLPSAPMAVSNTFSQELKCSGSVFDDLRRNAEKTMRTRTMKMEP
jgi:hypothetical protein